MDDRDAPYEVLRCGRCQSESLQRLETKDVIWCPLCGWELPGEYAVLRWGKALIVVPE